MLKRRVVLIAGPIAAGKTSLAALFDTGKVRIISFDENAHVFHPDTGYNNTVTNVDETINRLVKAITASHYAHDVVVDGWFSFFSHWWHSPQIMQLVTDLLQKQLGDNYEVQLCILGRKKQTILDYIEGDDSKFKYPDYDKVIDEKYRVMFDALMKWQDENGASKESTVQKEDQTQD